MSQSNLVRWALTGVAAGALGWSAPAFAQDAEPAAEAEASPVGIEEITVTAEKRESTLQDAALAVSAFTADDLENLNMLETRELANFTPGLTMTTFSNPTYAQAIIRGIGQGDFHPLYQSRVGFYLDGVYVGNQSGISSTLLDVDRIEVLRGPQGTLYGRNTLGGAINIVTKRPSGDFGGKVQVGVGEYGLREIRASVDFPVISETLSARISFYSGDRDSYEDAYQAVCSNSPGGCGYGPDLTNLSGPVVKQGSWDTEKGSDIWDMDRNAVTAQLSFTPNDRLTVDYTFNRFELEEGMIPEWMTDFMPQASLVGAIGLAGVYLPMLTGNEFIAVGRAAAAGYRDPTTFTPDFFSAMGKTALFGTGFDPANPATYAGAFTIAGTALAFNGGYTTADFSVGGRNSTLYCCNTQIVRDAAGNIVRMQDTGADTRTNFHALTATYDLTDEVEVKTIVSFREVAKSMSVSDIGFSRYPYFDAYSESPHEQIFAELQVNGVGMEGRLEYHAGISWFEDEFPYASEFGSDSFVALGPVNPLPDPNEGEGEAVGYYTQLGYNLTDRFKLTGGIRYSKEDKEYTLFDFLVPAGLPVPDLTDPDRAGKIAAINAAGLNNFTIKREYNGWTPMVRAELNWTDDLLIYAGWSRGYQGGNFNARVGPSFDPGLVDYDEEFISAWDAGVKSTWFDNRLQFNLAAYLYDWDDQQVQQSGFNNFTGQYEGFVGNVGKAELSGWEVEVRALPLPNLDVRFAYNFTDSKVDEWEDFIPEYKDLDACKATPTPAGCLEDSSYRKKIHGAPAREFSGSALYSFPAGGWGRPWAMLSFYKRGRRQIGSTDNVGSMCPFQAAAVGDPCPAAGRYNGDYLQTLGNSLATSPSYTVWNARIQVDDVFGQQGLYLALIGENIADRDHGVSTSAFSSAVFGRITTQYGPPERYRFEVGMSFGAAN